MIIKSMARKKPNFKQLIRYMNQEADPYFIFTQHLSSDDPLIVQQAFKENYSYLVRKGKQFNALYHEVISLKRMPNIPLNQYIQAMYELVPRYLSLRGPMLLGYGTLHIKDHHLHVHLMLSANNLGQEKRHCLTRFEFALVQRLVESFVLKYYPELRQEPVLSKTQPDYSLRHVRDMDYPLHL